MLTGVKLLVADLTRLQMRLLRHSHVLVIQQAQWVQAVPTAHAAHRTRPGPLPRQPGQPASRAMPPRAEGSTKFRRDRKCH